MLFGELGGVVVDGREEIVEVGENLFRGPVGRFVDDCFGV